MRSAVIDTLFQRMDDQALDQIGGTIGADPVTTRRAIGIALPMLIGGLAREANHSRSHAEALVRRIDSIADDRTNNGDRTVEYVFGTKRPLVEAGISTVSGLDILKVRQMLPMLAPMVMQAVRQIKQERGLNADGLASLLNRERAEVERELPLLRRGALMDMLEYDDESQIVKEVQKIKAGVLEGGVFGKILGPV